MVRTESGYAPLHSITVRYAHCSDSLLGCLWCLKRASSNLIHTGTVTLKHDLVTVKGTKVTTETTKVLSQA